ncbi:MAG: LamG-like jellyroll fold domain-containing protein [Prevotella sp.]|nr:LamG-like jellyroll fold domain-containing protein [Prevotella sp.]
MNNKKTTLLASMLLCGCVFGYAQRTPTHPLDIQDKGDKYLLENILNWEAGTPPREVSAMDDQFYISRVRPLPRIAEADDYQAEVSKQAKPGRKMCLWTPLDDPTSSWKALPRYCFEGDNFSMWSYLNIHGNWTAPWFRVTGGLSDVAHKNGVAVGCVASIPWSASVNVSASSGWGKTFGELTKKNSDGTYANVERFVKILKYYGIDGVGVNSEFHANAATMKQIQGFFAACHKEAEKIGWKFQLHWYDGTNDYGAITFDSGLGTHNKAQFGDKDNVVTDMMFSNYNTGNGTLKKSAEYAKSMGRDPYDYYKGFDIQGRSLHASNANWNDLNDVEASVGFWGAHSQGLIHQSATDYGTSDVAIQQAYLDKQELVFSGGNRNPANTPDILGWSDVVTLANGSLKGKFHGVASYVTAKSTIQQVPFVTRFNLGNGLTFKNEGEVTFNHKWHNIATQDYMPTWRWWIVDGNESAKSADLAQAELTWDDAYWGGSCLRLKGQTTTSRVKLFKTLLKTEPSYNISLTYKMSNELDTHAKLFVALKGKLTEYKEIDIPAAEKFGQWTTFTTTLDKLGLKSGDEIAMIGIRLDNTAKDYNMLVGELAVRNPQQKFAPVAPKIKEIDVLRGKDKTCDFKIRYAAKEETGGEKTYNDEVDTWYYEIWFQQKGEKEQYLTATTSWAAYVVDAPMVIDNPNVADATRDCRFGVRAVSPDGLQKSEISWSPYQTVEYDTPSTEVAIDRQVIKPNEQFKVYYEDQFAPNAQSFRLLNAQTGAQVGEKYSNCNQFTTSVPEVGVYDLEVVNDKGATEIFRGKVIISPEKTGAVPVVETVTADKQTAETNEEIKLNYTSRDGEGKVSRGLVVKDPNMLLIPAEVTLDGGNKTSMAYSYALWVKVDNYAHDKQGTNLIQKNTISDKWPHNNWGDLWVQIRPQINAGEHDCRNNHLANEVSFNTFGWTAHDNPRESMMSTGYALNPGVWNHIVVTQGSDKQQKIYFNGKCVAGPDYFAASDLRENSSDYRINTSEHANVFIGGGGVYKAGLNATIDEVQVWNKPLTDAEVVRAMQGYAANEIPEGLMGYYTFEEMDKSDSTFVNLGKAGAQYKARMVVMNDSGGENTSTASYKTVGANNEVTGYPGIDGTLEVKTSHTWQLNGGRISSEDDKAAVVTFARPGEYEAGVKLTNFWGESEKALENVLVITGVDAINDVKDAAGFSVYPNPFVESVNLRFSEGGFYTINIVSAAGAVLQSNDFRADAGETVNVAVQGGKGMYIVQVLKDGKPFKALNVIKK